MKKLLTYVLVIFYVSISGCTSPSRPPDPPICRVVTEITVRTESGTEADLRHFSQPREMTKLLNYLRHLDLWDKADPIPSADPRYRITLHLSDGTQKVYDQIGTLYMRECDGPWMQIPDEKGLRLNLLLVALR